MTWLVFYVRGKRIASIENTSENKAEAQARMNMRLIQRDVTGTEHWEVISRP